MVKKVETAIVSLWGEQVAAVSWLDDAAYAVFEYQPAFVKKGLDIAPIQMPLSLAASTNAIFSFPTLNKDTFRGLPGLLADSLPDKFGNNIIDAWLARQGRDVASFSPIERLCYVGKRGMGALEFAPIAIKGMDKPVAVEVAELVALAQQITQERTKIDVSIDTSIGASEKENQQAIADILRVGTSAGGARPKAVIAMNAEGRVVSGQGEAPVGFDYWLLKFDGVSDLELGEPKQFGRIEYAYHLMARQAGIEMSECRLLEENGRAHFLTKRFDRAGGEKLHMQSLCGIAHYDFNIAGAYGYEQAFMVMRQLRLSKAEAIQQYRRMLFNVIARNQDDHTKNIAFLMDQDGKWRLSPAFDVTYSHNPAGQWTNQHQMSIYGKRDGFELQDLISIGESISVSRPQQIIEEVRNTVAQWPVFAKEAGVSESLTKEIGTYHRLGL